MGDTVRERRNQSDGAGTPSRPVSSSVSAVVLTHRRPRLATAVVRSLIEREGLPPDRVVVVVNGSGGLEDPALESRVRLLRLPHNLGPAGGFAAGMEAVFADPSVNWAYLCEDDVGLFSLPSPRLADVVSRAECRSQLPGRPVGAVVAFGRRFVNRGAHTENFVPPAGERFELVPVDVASWGATLLARRVFDAGIFPDPSWFFGLEDFDFYCRVRQGGFDVLVDAVSARAVAEQQTSEGRVGALSPHRPTDERESWRSYYHARNSIFLVRRYGRPTWHVWHLAYSARHLQKAAGNEERRAILHGLWDGYRGRFGENPAYGRTVGEHAEGDEDSGSRDA
jgi:hypothetical protein